ncbi:GtrA family protein [Halosolutus gelatinilyticus]|uniref:GtrA family protein n=1 Tax=Halosolutus gelatinilyticus TaxID=2931975 RepID=UPI001FF18165|nr:GtrA family protein [Halosolutus gelatinilyticus]
MIEPSDLRSAIESPARAGQFASVGVVGAIVDSSALGLLVESGALEPLAAKLVAVELAIVVMFALNERWTFGGHGLRTARRILARLAKSHAVRIAGTAVAIGALYALHAWFGVWYLIANLVGIGAGFVVNYLLESTYTWKVQDRDAS